MPLANYTVKMVQKKEWNRTRGNSCICDPGKGSTLKHNKNKTGQWENDNKIKGNLRAGGTEPEICPSTGKFLVDSCSSQYNEKGILLLKVLLTNKPRL